jgi:hypothetical protein
MSSTDGRAGRECQLGGDEAAPVDPLAEAVMRNESQRYKLRLRGVREKLPRRPYPPLPNPAQAFRRAEYLAETGRTELE